ncbi:MULTISPECIES: hypothetical protein [Enterococcus]|nr:MULTISPECIES: hypothetical protein [unclassified Enterococcus]
MKNLKIFLSMCALVLISAGCNKNNGIEKNTNTSIEQVSDSKKAKMNTKKGEVSETKQQAVAEQQASEQQDDPNWGNIFSDPNLSSEDYQRLGREKGEYYRNKYGQ